MVAVDATRRNLSQGGVLLYVDPNSTKYRPTSDEWSEARRRRLGPSVKITQNVWYGSLKT